MKSVISKFFLATFILAGTLMYAQQPAMQFFRPNDARGLNVFEAGKEDTVPFTGVKVRVGGDYAIQYQALSHENSSLADTLVELGSNVNLPTANLNLDVQLYDGVRLHIRTYLSSRHHAEAWVKGGYMRVDKLDFIKEGFAEDLMKVLSIRVGMDEYNYGDVHFRRSDNGRAIFNPFVGNYIMDAFSTEPFIEFTAQKDGWLGVFGVTNGRLNQSAKPGDDGMVIFGKAGYDKQLNDDLRVRLTGSFYSSTDESTRDYLYGGDRAGSRYYSVYEGINGGNRGDFSGRFNTGYGSQTAFQINPFVKFQGLEFFGVYENVSNGDDAVGGDFTQLGAELLYRFGKNENFYVGGRFNNVSGEQSDNAATQEIQRINAGAGWYMTKNIMIKAEYVTEERTGDGWLGGNYEGGAFDGAMLEAVISF